MMSTPTRSVRIPGDPRGDRELVVRGARERFVVQLAGEALRHGEHPRGVGSAMEEVERRAGVEAQPAALADGQIARVEQTFGATKRFGRACERQEAGDGPDLELVLLACSLGVGIVEEIRRRLV